MILTQFSLPKKIKNIFMNIYFLGANLRTGDEGIFPLAHVVDVDYSDFDPVTGGQRDDKKERYLLDYLGSVETSLYKGCSNSSPLFY